MHGAAHPLRRAVPGIRTGFPLGSGSRAPDASPPGLPAASSSPALSAPS